MSDDVGGITAGASAAHGVVLKRCALGDVELRQIHMRTEEVRGAKQVPLRALHPLLFGHTISCHAAKMVIGKRGEAASRRRSGGARKAHGVQRCEPRHRLPSHRPPDARPDDAAHFSRVARGVVPVVLLRCSRVGRVVHSTNGDRIEPSDAVAVCRVGLVGVEPTTSRLSGDHRGSGKTVVSTLFH